MDGLAVLKPGSDPLGQQNPAEERQNRQQVVGSLEELPLGGLKPKQNDITGLCIGKYVPAQQIGVSIQKSAHHSEQNSHRERIRHLFLFQFLSHKTL